MKDASTRIFTIFVQKIHEVIFLAQIGAKIIALG